MMRILKSVSTLVSASCLPGLCGRNVLQLSKQMVSTQCKCLNLNNVSATPVNIALLRLNYSTERLVSGGAKLAKCLDEEIEVEQQELRDSKSIPSQLRGFKIQLNDGEIILVKRSPAETISIYLNVSNSLTAVEEFEPVNPSDNAADAYSLISKPDFRIEFKRGDTVLRVYCSCSIENFVDGTDDEEEDYKFNIDAVSIFKEKCQETNYLVKGNALVSEREMLHNFLYKKGVPEYIVKDLVELCNAYEHTRYVTLLKDLKKFVQ